VRVAVAGSSGLIGSALLPALREAGHETLRIVRREAAAGEVSWDPAKGTIDAASLAGVEAIVNLSGVSIAARWTATRKRGILESRTTSTRLVAETAASLEPRPSVLLCASAVGFYGSRGEEVLTEASPRGDGFLADVVEQWEAATLPAREAGIRVVHCRHAPVLSRRGSILRRLLPPFRLGLGGRIGSGEQWWSWIAMEDLTGAYVHLLEHSLAGPVNVAAPQPVRNRDFVRELARALHRPARIPFPSLAVEALLGEMGREVVLASQRVLPAALGANGYAMRCPTLAEGLASALAR